MWGAGFQTCTLICVMHLCYFAVSCYSLFPLLFEAQEYPIKVLLLLLHSIIMWLAFSAQFTKDETATIKKKDDQLDLKRSSNATAKRGGGFVIGGVEKSYLVGLLAVEIWGQLLHPLLFGDKLSFVPLMLISLYSGLGIMYSWIWQLRWIIRSPNI
jgi:alpha-1,3-glucosyltransferase